MEHIQLVRGKHSTLSFSTLARMNSEPADTVKWYTLSCKSSYELISCFFHYTSFEVKSSDSITFDLVEVSQWQTHED